MKNGIWAVLPLKGLKNSKKRLSNILSEPERMGLVAAMAQDMLSALTRSRLAGILVVSDSDEIGQLVRSYPVELIPESKNKGLSEAISHAATVLSSRNIKAMMVIHGDIPLIQTEDINTVLEAVQPKPSVTIVPCKNRDGTNVMVCSPPDIIPFYYGQNSFSSHLNAALKCGIKTTQVINDRLALDIDTASDLKDLLGHMGKGEVGQKTSSFLKGINLASRLI
ncbi:MAG: 2-phospho-L-lactate guanylyltransferase [Emcibacter sp.]|nr:2-phospho-L-lactate guanylyltransferase [Emcibacter sp.]